MTTKLSTARTPGIQDAMDRLDLKRARIKQLAKAGRIGEMIAGRYLFSPKELADFAKIKRPSGRPKTSPSKDLGKSAGK